MEEMAPYIKNKTAVIIVKGRAFLMNNWVPFLKFFLSSVVINVIECLTECRKQKYKVNAIKGGKK